MLVYAHMCMNVCVSSFIQMVAHCSHWSRPCYLKLCYLLKNFFNLFMVASLLYTAFL